MRLLLSIIVLIGAAQAQLTSGVIDSSRAIDWTSKGVSGGIPTNYTQSGSTISAGASVTTINTAIAAACGASKYVLLGPGSFSLGNQITISNCSNVILRGSGPSSTFVTWTSSAGGCIGLGGDICIEDSTQRGQQNPANVAPWTAGYSVGTTSITLTTPSTGAITGLVAGQMLSLTQCNTGYSGIGCATVGTLGDNGNIWNCDDAATGTTSHNCATEGGEGITATERSQGQNVTVVSCTGANSAACSSGTATSPYTVVFSPGLEMPNWASGQTPEAYWNGSTVSYIGIENMSLDHTNGSNAGIFVVNALNVWVKNVRDMNSGRAHVWCYNCARLTLRDSYIFGTQNAASQSYGVEADMASDLLIENNIAQQETSPWILGKQANGSVIAYNFSVNDYYCPNCPTPSATMQGALYGHASGMNFNLMEGNIGASMESDAIHGTEFFITAFRNRLFGWEPGKSSSTNAAYIYAYNRYFNLVANVLGAANFTTTYQCNTANGTDSCGAPDVNIYEIGYSGNGSFCSNCGGEGDVNNDTFVASSMMRWGNYDTVNAVNRFNTGEVPSGISPYANAVPTTTCTSGIVCPSSFYLSGKPSWWNSNPWPNIGPEITGGNVLRCTSGTYVGMSVTNSSQCNGGSSTSDVGGRIYSNPAMDCYLTTMSGPPDGTGNALTFDANNCYQASNPAATSNVNGATVKGTVFN